MIITAESNLSNDFCTKNAQKIKPPQKFQMIFQRKYVILGKIAEFTAKLPRNCR